MNCKTVLTKTATIATGHGFLWVVNNAFDWILYPLAIFQFGLGFGFLIMASLSVVLNLSLVKLYDVTGKDWLGAESLKEAEEYLGEKKAWIKKLLDRSKILKFVAFSTYDPFIATVYFRKREQAFKGLSARDWKIFWGATLVGNGLWALGMFSGIEAFKFLAQ